ncbi:hypothetical protein [Streptomyces sp. WMMB 322]|uniref:hypothetical protein n=1 Tax=Streptomyces sp. WMMB 322 TaxID=1286821 RepID=UPI0011131D76|nr:hypothetical protein [Streptomyces sp. WMMB 322]
MTEIPDSKVGQLLTLLDRSGVPDQLESLLQGRPGPAGIRPRTVLAGLLLAAYYTGRATVAAAWRILHFSLQRRARGWLGIPHQSPGTAHECIASSRRLYRALDRITTVLDPARHDRRRRLPKEIASEYAKVWNSPAGRQAAALLQRLANQLVLAPVRLAQARGHLRGWQGDVGVDATPIPVLAHPDSGRSHTASVEITAGWHYSAGSSDGIFGYSATLVVAAHTKRPEQGKKALPYPQLCLGLALDTPTVRTGQNAIAALTQLGDLGLPTGTCAADRAYTGCSPGNFQVPARQLGYRLALDYKANERGVQGSWEGALLVDGCLACPHMPTALAQVTRGAKDGTVRNPPQEMKAALEERAPFYFKTKESPDARGTIRLQCPARGPSPTVNCLRHDRLRPDRTGPPTTVINLHDARARARHPAALPTVQLPASEWHEEADREHLPPACVQSSISVPADAAGDWRTAKYRQDSQYLSDTWKRTYQPIRSHNEGINGRLKSEELDIGNPKHRPAPGQVAQTLLTAIMITVGNLDILDTWLEVRTGSNLVDLDYESIPAPVSTQTEAPETAIRPPPQGG